MSIALIVLVFLVAVGAHELGHSLAMRTYKIRTREAGLGLPIPPQVTVFRRGDFEFKVGLWLLGAYVSSFRHIHGNDTVPCRDDDPVGRLPVKQQIWVLNAGVVVNVLLFGAGAAAYAVFHGDFAFAGILAACTLILFAVRRPFAVYVLPALSLPCLALTAWAFTQVWAAGETGLGFASLGQFAPHTAGDALKLFATVNLALALINALPLPPLDNGKVTLMLVERWWGKKVGMVYQFVGTVLVMSSLVGAVGSDLWAVIT